MMNRHRIALIPGDGIGPEVMSVGLAALKAAAGQYDIRLEIDELDWSCATYFARHGAMLPIDWPEKLKAYEAIYFGAVGAPHIVPDHVAIWGSILAIRRGFDQYVNLRPVRLMPGVPCPLAGKSPGDIDFVIIRENTEGEYSEIGGRAFAGTDRELVIQETIFTRHGVDRILRYAFELASRRRRKKLTAATKSNGIAMTMPYWDERVELMARGFPAIEWERQHIDILAARFVSSPERFDVVVASNLFGDILSDLGPACAGTIGIAPSANLNPERNYPSLFEPVHGSAPDIAGKGIANPIAAVWSGAMLLDFLGHGEGIYRDAHDRILHGIEAVLVSGPRTPDLGGNSTTREMGAAIVAAIEATSDEPNRAE
ncbi:MAG: tartrate dehydrogenase [Steroidobacteraceae bacterium]|nr:tartrate dehydrogenase [Steroidobacteraceae bacterium]